MSKYDKNVENVESKIGIEMSKNVEPLEKKVFFREVLNQILGQHMKKR